MFDADVVGAHCGVAGVLIFLACVRYGGNKAMVIGVAVEIHARPLKLLKRSCSLAGS
jgi:hypothetical protein